MKQVWKEAFVAWGTVNLLFFRQWSKLLPDRWDYLLGGPRSPVAYLSLMVLVVLLAAAAFAVVRTAQRSRNPHLMLGVRIAFLLAIIVGFNGLLYEAWIYAGYPQIPAWIPWSLGGGTLLLLAFLQWRSKGWHHRVVPVAFTAMLLLAPLAPILYAQGLYQAVTQDSEAPPWSVSPNAEPTGQRGDHRVVWIVFDELDQRIAFEEPPDDLQLPEFERLRETAFSATNAYTPHSQTLFSVPSMTTGRITDPVLPEGPSSLAVFFRDTETVEHWEDTETVFHWAREHGHDTAVVGTYHPYCRLFNEHLVDCHHYEYDGGFGHRLLPHLAEHLEGLLTSIPTPALREPVTKYTALYTPLHRYYQQSAIDNHRELVPKAVETATRDDIDFAFLHFLVPHPVGLKGTGLGYYDRVLDDYATGTRADYFDNLVLADRILGQIRSAMEKNGTWENTTVIVTSDHGYRGTWWGENPSTRDYGDLLLRPTEHRVPLIVKPATGSPTPHHHENELNTVLLGPLVQHALAHGFSDTQQVAEWFDAQPPTGARPGYFIR